MDQATRRLRARNKQMTNGRGNLPDFAPRGLGRKAKPAEVFPVAQCEYIVGGKKILIWRRRKDGSKYAIPLIKGGTRCLHTVLASKRCANHLGVEQ